MKNLLLIILLSLLLIVGGCNQTEVLCPTTQQPRHYLILNNVNIADQVLKNSDENSLVTVNYPIISGLKDERVQSQINKTLKERALKYLKDGENFVSDRDNATANTYYYISANYNNVICVNFQNYYFIDDENYYDYHPSFMRHYSSNHRIVYETFVFELVNGTQLSLKDIFNHGYDYQTPITKIVTAEIFKKNLEDDVLYRPLTTISQDQDFYITQERLVVVFNPDNPYFKISWPKEFSIPLYKFDEAVVLYDKFSSHKELYTSDKVSKQLLSNPISLKEKRIDVEGVGYWMEATYPVLGDLKNAKVEEYLNKFFEDKAQAFIDEENQRDFANHVQVIPSNFKYDMPHKTLNTYVAGNFGGILSVIEYCYSYLVSDSNPQGGHSHYSNSYNFYLEDGKEVTLRELFRDGVDYVELIKSLNKYEGLNNGYDVNNINFYVTHGGLGLDFPNYVNRYGYSQGLSFYIPFEDIQDKLRFFE